MVGKTVKHYEITAELGQGGMGVVYKATDTVLGRTVALKFLPASTSSDEKARERFAHEARAVSALDHPNVAVVHEIGESGDGDMFIVMAYYEGRTLEDIIKEGPVPLEDVLGYALDMARGLAAAHDQGIIHRDIKPGNVMVTDSGFLKILDFGLAKVQDVTMTVGEASIGTLAYMSPEQAQGAPVDVRTDLWALGVVLYELLAGKRPFDGPYDAAILYAAVNTDHEDVTIWRDDAPEALARVIDKLLQKSPDARYQTAHELLADLRALTGEGDLSGLSVMSQLSGIRAAETSSAEEQAHGAPEDVGPGAGRGAASSSAPRGAFFQSTYAKLGAVATGAVLVGVGAFFAMSGGGASSAETAAIEATIREQARSFLDRGISFLRDGKYELALAELERSLQYDSTYGPAWSSLSGVYYQLNDYGSAIRAANRALAIDGTNTIAYYNRGLAEAGQGQTGRAMETLSQATEMDSTFTQAYSALADLLIESGRAADALPVLDRASQTASTSLRFIIYKNQGKAHMALGDAATALDYLEPSLRLNPDWPETVLLMARAYDSLGDRSEARRYWERVLEVETRPALRAEARRRLEQD
ncbi:MAG: hypothetical protein COV99_05770 [Bacteroidetes bacterium CG12_big_fil_rev_8_21_14_0_65_60_17]|nr:MAG: hypothetical protein COV99_05770 [Bacteroidetes bacterium CG12_big_fil_rev_8_21_14_0_65_60_17]